jgi:UMF1 family MFS transporter
MKSVVAYSAVESGSSESMRKLPVLSWALYDFANTIFSFAIATRYFNQWIITEQGGQDWYIAAMNVVVTVFLVFSLPIFGAISDVYGRQRPFLAAFTLTSVVSTASLVLVDSTLAALVVCGFAIYCYQSALAHYDPLLAEVAPPHRHGFVSGLGVSLGYLGVLLALPVFLTIVDAGNSQQAFVPTAMMYGIIALPCLLFVREGKRDRFDDRSFRQIAGGAMQQLSVSARSIRAHRDVVRLLAGRFLYVDALAVLIAYMTVYLDRMGGFTEGDKTLILGSSIVCAVVGALVVGAVVERIGPRRILLGILAALSVALMVAAGAGSGWTAWLVGPMVGVGLGTVWTCDRLFMMRLTPPSARGEFFGVYNLVGKVGGAVGPVIWGATVYIAHQGLDWGIFDASRLALAVMVIPALGGAWVIRSLDDTPRTWGDDELEQQLEGLHR